MRQVANWLDGYIQYTDNSEPCELYRKWVGLSVLASCLQRKCWIEWGHDLTWYPNLYLVLVGPSGKARKGTAMGQGLRFLASPRLNVNIAAQSMTREAVIKSLVDAEQVAHSNGKDVIVHSSITFYSDELAVLMGKQEQLISDLNNWYDNPRVWSYHTKNSGAFDINGLWVNMLGATTPTLLHDYLPASFIGSGLGSRIIFIYAADKGKIVADPFLSPSMVKLGEKLLDDLVEINELSGRFNLTIAAAEKWFEWYPAQAENPPFKDSKFDYYFERRPGYVWKLALIMSAAMGSSKIVDLEHIEKAIALLEEVEIPMHRALSGVGRSNLAAIQSAIMQIIFDREDTTREYLQNRFRNDATKDEIDMILSALEAMGFSSLILNTGKIKFNQDWSPE